MRAWETTGPFWPCLFLEKEFLPWRIPLIPGLTQGLDSGAREAVNAVFDALSAWRNEVGACTERHNETVLDKMTAAASAMGWPKELVEASRKYLVLTSKTHTYMIDQLMDAWQKQLQSPMPSQFMAQLWPLPGMGLGATSGMPGLAIAPVQFWMQAAEMWQRNWASTFSMWAHQVPGKMGARDGAARSH
jgi:hypothetical protein